MYDWLIVVESSHCCHLLDSLHATYQAKSFSHFESQHKFMIFAAIVPFHREENPQKPSRMIELFKDLSLDCTMV